MPEPIKDVLNKLSLEEIKMLPTDDRSRYFERYLFELIKTQERAGITQKELEGLTGLSGNTLSKYLELLFSKRNVYRVKKGNNVTYFPNGRVHTFINKDVTVYDKSGIEHRYKAYAVDNPDGKFLYLQEREVDRRTGIENVIGGVLIPETGIAKFKGIFGEFENTFKNVTVEE